MFFNILYFLWPECCLKLSWHICNERSLQANAPKIKAIHCQKFLLAADARSHLPVLEQTRCPDTQKRPGRCGQIGVYLGIWTSIGMLLLIFWTVCCPSLSVPSRLSERTLDILKSPKCFEWLSSKMKNECSQEISKACSLESIILGFTLHQNCPLKSKT